MPETTLRAELEAARRAMEKNASRLDKIAEYVARHGTDRSALKAILGVSEDLTASAIHAENTLAKEPA